MMTTVKRRGEVFNLTVMHSANELLETWYKKTWTVDEWKVRVIAFAVPC